MPFQHVVIPCQMHHHPPYPDGDLVQQSTRIGELLLELYPTKGEPDNVRLGFSVFPALLAQFNLTGHGKHDPDGRVIVLSADD